MMKNNNKRIYLVPALFVLLLILVSHAAINRAPGRTLTPPTKILRYPSPARKPATLPRRPKMQPARKRKY